MKNTHENNRQERTVLVYTRFNRIWHWLQVIAIFTLLFTGFRIADFHQLIPFKQAVAIHTITAVALAVLWIFIFFWLATTGNWKQFIPSTQGLLAVFRFYSFGVFKGEEHPYRRILKKRLNPLQAGSYLALNAILVPVIWISGILYLTHGFWSDKDLGSQTLSLIANVHLFGAFAFVAFIIVHVYMLTIGHGFRRHVKPMLSGYDQMEVTPEEVAYLEQMEPKHIKQG